MKCLLNVCLCVQALAGAESLLVIAQCGARLHNAEFDLHACVKQLWVMTNARPKPKSTGPPAVPEWP